MHVFLAFFLGKWGLIFWRCVTANACTPTELVQRFNFNLPSLTSGSRYITFGEFRCLRFWYGSGCSRLTQNRLYHLSFCQWTMPGWQVHEFPFSTLGKQNKKNRDLTQPMTRRIYLRITPYTLRNIGEHRRIRRSG